VKIFWKLSLTILVLFGACSKKPVKDGVYLIYKDGHEVTQLMELSSNEDWTLTSSKGTLKHKATPTPTP